MLRMTFPLRVISAGATIIVCIFVALFVYLTAKWSVKRGREISKRFEYETKELEESEVRLGEIKRRINSLKTDYDKAVRSGDLKKADALSKEINRLKKEREKLFKKIQEY